MALKKAMILVKAGHRKEQIDVLFNPSEYTMQSGNKYSWQTIPGASLPIGQFISGDASTLSMDLFFDTYETRADVRQHTRKISGLLNVDKDLHAPPLCEFVWGSLHFKGVVEQVQQNFTMFLDSGIPVRAKLKVTFRLWQGLSEQFREIPRQSADRTKSRVVKQGEQLWMIAHEEYDNPGLWREIALANGIDNPLQLNPGQRLVIPRLE